MKALHYAQKRKVNSDRWNREWKKKSNKIRDVATHRNSGFQPDESRGLAVRQRGQNGRRTGTGKMPVLRESIGD
jgi:hypothetical protein